MSTKKLTVLGISEAGISMIFDILESNSRFDDLIIVNNFEIEPQKEFINPKFKFRLLTVVDNFENDFTLGVVKSNTRRRVRESFENISINKFVNLISDDAKISSMTELGYGIIINTSTSVAAHTYLDDFVYINRSCSVGHHTKIGKFSTINPGVNVAGNVTVGDNCQIGIGTNIFDGVTIGNNTIIGGGSVVTKDIPSNVIAYGNPCKVIKQNVK